MTHLIADMLALSRLDAGKFPLEPAPVNVRRGIVDQAIRMARFAGVVLLLCCAVLCCDRRLLFKGVSAGCAGGARCLPRSGGLSLR